MKHRFFVTLGFLLMAIESLIMIPICIVLIPLYCFEFIIRFAFWYLYWLFTGKNIFDGEFIHTKIFKFFLNKQETVTDKILNYLDFYQNEESN